MIYSGKVPNAIKSLEAATELAFSPTPTSPHHRATPSQDPV